MTMKEIEKAMKAVQMKMEGRTDLDIMRFLYDEEEEEEEG